ncbi:Alcohol dehydrogenase transcription factor Myb/SANT-like [Popillia japonica]|uniref:Alcohol dehydrogenase transcription factor Myb/SANT-like n=1 Tax=Popillia japonica TaxID=7064 RepID=A0AAW1N3W4_POPJA
MSWSHEQIEEPIELYKAWPCLCAVKTWQYKNRHARTKGLEEIETALKKITRNTTVAEIKAKMNTLRSNFLAEARKIKNIKSGAGEDENEESDFIEGNQSSEALIMPENSLDSAIKNTPSNSKQFRGQRKRKWNDDAILYDVAHSITSISSNNRSEI